MESLLAVAGISSLHLLVLIQGTIDGFLKSLSFLFSPDPGRFIRLRFTCSHLSRCCCRRCFGSLLLFSCCNLIRPLSARLGASKVDKRDPDLRAQTTGLRWRCLEGGRLGCECRRIGIQS